jgi:hypothetical protein
VVFFSACLKAESVKKAVILLVLYLKLHDVFCYSRQGAEHAKKSLSYLIFPGELCALAREYEFESSVTLS